MSFDPKSCRLFGHSINVIIKFGCVLAFITIAFYQRRKYYRNEDATIFSVKQFQGTGWQYFPAITLCFSTGEYTISEALFNSTSIRSELNLTVEEYGNIILGVKDHDDKKKIIDFDFEKNTMNLKKYLKKLRIQDTNENEYEWKYYDDLELPNPEFSYQINRPFDWNKKTNITKNDIPLIPKYLDPYVKCFSHHPELDHETAIDSIDFYFYISKLESIVDGNMYIYVHHPGQLIRNMRYIYKIRHFTGISRNNSNNHLVLDINHVRMAKSRSDAVSECNDLLHFDDQEWLQQLMRNISCIPPYWKSLYAGVDNVTVCASKAKLNQVTSYLAFKNAYGVNEIIKKYLPPCNKMKVSAVSNKDQYKKDDLLKITFRFR